MKKVYLKTVFVLFVTLQSTEVTHAQKVICTLDIRPSLVAETKSMEVGDSLFIAFKLKQTDNKYLYRWISKEGKVAAIFSPGLDFNRLYAVTTIGKSIFYYMLDPDRKSFKLKALEYDKATSRFVGFTETLELDGTLYASYVQGGQLMLITNLKKEGQRLNLLGIQGGTTVSSVSFPISIDLSNFKKAEADFQFAATPQVPFFAGSALKFIKDGNVLWAIADICKDPPMFERPPDPKQPKTIVLKLDIKNPENSESKAFFTSTEAEFRSTFFNGTLIRMFVDENLNVEGINYSTKEEVFATRQWKRAVTEPIVTWNRGKTFLAKNGSSTKPYEIPYNIVVANEAEDGSIVLALGRTVEESQTASYSSPSSPGGFITLTPLNALNPEVIGYNYFFMKVEANGKINPISEGDSFMHQVDKFGEGIDVNLISVSQYIRGRDKIYLIKGLKKETSVSVVEFVKK
jgi:hypothetical protein